MTSISPGMNTAGKIRKVTYLGGVVNLVLAVMKMVFGWLAGSMALVTDAVHSLSDIVTDIAVLVGSEIGSREPDPNHPYGHGRFETIAGMIIAIILVVVGGAAIHQAGMAIARGKTSQHFIGWSALVVALISIIAKEALYWITRHVAQNTHSPALYANAWHHRSDAFSSVAVLVGLVASKAGYQYGDQLAAIAVGLMIIFVGVKILGRAFEEFSGHACDQETIETIEQIVSKQKGIRGWHKLRTRVAGREVFVDLHILVDPQLNIKQAHEVSNSLEQSIYDQLTRPVNILVHIEPDLPEERIA